MSYKKLKDYILENDFKVTYIKDKLNIVNYKEIYDISESKITIASEKITVKIIGEKLCILKLLDKEVLIGGLIKNIEFR